MQGDGVGSGLRRGVFSVGRVTFYADIAAIAFRAVDGSMNCSPRLGSTGHNCAGLPGPADVAEVACVAGTIAVPFIDMDVFVFPLDPGARGHPRFGEVALGFPIGVISFRRVTFAADAMAAGKIDGSVLGFPALDGSGHGARLDILFFVGVLRFVFCLIDVARFVFGVFQSVCSVPLFPGQLGAATAIVAVLQPRKFLG